jgi:hypothetical protein
MTIEQFAFKIKSQFRTGVLSTSEYFDEEGGACNGHSLRVQTPPSSLPGLRLLSN